ncbi:MAG: monovalent cation/H(+) antiporter subunit G [Opitutales bacterium]
MTFVQYSLAALLIVVGLLIMLAGSIGILRLPDFFTRTHAASKVDTTGIIFLLAGLAVYEGFSFNSGKLLIGIAFVMLANPVAIHALARAAWRFGERPWMKEDPHPGKKGRP